MSCKFCFSPEYTERCRVAEYFPPETEEEYKVEYEILENHDILLIIDWIYQKHVHVTAELHTIDLSTRISSGGQVVIDNKVSLLLCNKAKVSLIMAQYELIITITVTPYVNLCKPPDEGFLKHPSPESVVDSLSGLSMDLKELLETKAMTDASVSNGKIRLNVHKAILSARSPVFRTKFSTGKKYKKCITISYISDEALLDLINFIYSAIFEFRNIELVRELYKVSYEYEVEDLFETCSKYLTEGINADNALNLVRLAYDYNDENLKYFAMDFLSDNMTEIKTTEVWKSYSENHPNIVTDILNFITRHIPKKADFSKL